MNQSEAITLLREALANVLRYEHASIYSSYYSDIKAAQQALTATEHVSEPVAAIQPAGDAVAWRFTLASGTYEGGLNYELFGKEADAKDELRLHGGILEALAIIPSATAPAHPAYDECPASGLSCSYGPNGEHGESQCTYCGKPAQPEAKDEAVLHEAALQHIIANAYLCARGERMTYGAMDAIAKAVLAALAAPVPAAPADTYALLQEAQQECWKRGARISELEAQLAVPADKGELPDAITLFESILSKDPDAFLRDEFDPIYQVTEPEVCEFASAIILADRARQAVTGKVEANKPEDCALLGGKCNCPTACQRNMKNAPLLSFPVLHVAAKAVADSAEVWTGFAALDAKTCIQAALQAAAPSQPAANAVEHVIEAIKAAPARIASSADTTPKGNMLGEFPASQPAVKPSASNVEYEAVFGKDGIFKCVQEKVGSLKCNAAYTVGPDGPVDSEPAVKPVPDESECQEKLEAAIALIELLRGDIERLEADRPVQGSIGDDTEFLRLFDECETTNQHARIRAREKLASYIDSRQPVAASAKDAERLDWLVENMAIVNKEPSGNFNVLRKVTALSGYGDTTEYSSAHKAIDAAMKAAK